jgi:hypothetical protein
MAMDTSTMNQCTAVVHWLLLLPLLLENAAAVVGTTKRRGEMAGLF